MVAATVAVFHLMGICTGSQGHELMAETDGKDGDFCVIKLFDLTDHSGTFLRISRTIGKHDAIRSGGDDLLGCGICRINRNLTASLI